MSGPLAKLLAFGLLAYFASGERVVAQLAAARAGQPPLHVEGVLSAAAPETPARISIELHPDFGTRISDDRGGRWVIQRGRVLEGTLLPLPAWLYVWLPFAFNALLLLPLLGAALWLDARLKRAVLTWYAAPWLRQWFIPICWAITLVLAGLLWLVILPLLVIPLFGNLTDLWGPPGLWLMLTTLGAAVGGLWFMQANRRWQQRCSCGNRSTNPFQLGMSCPGCGQLLNAWLVATYKLTP